MKGLICLILTVIILPCGEAMIENRQRNIMCKDSKTANGFKFSHECIGTISVYKNETLITYAKLSNKSHAPKYLSQGMRIDNESFFMKECQDLQIKCIIRNGSIVKESRLTIKTKREDENSDSNDTQWGLYIGVALSLLGFPWIVWLLYSRRIKCFRCERHHKGSEVQEVRVDSLDRNHNTVISLTETQSAAGPHGVSENEEDITLKNVQGQSIDPQADGEDPETLSLLHNICSDATQLSKDGDKSVLDGPSNHRDMHRSLRDDPGGVIASKAEDNIGMREMQNGRTLGDRGPEDDKNERKLLLPIQGAAIQCSDMTDEAAHLVIKSGLNHDRGCRRSPASDTDVELVPRTKNYSIQVY